MLRMILAVAFALGVVACQNKTGKKASGLAEEHNKLGAWLTQAHPDRDWSVTDLNTFEANLNRYEQTERQLFRMDGKDGVSIRGGRNDRFIMYKRMELKMAREAQDPNYAPPVPRRRRAAELDTPATSNEELVQPAADNDIFVDDVDASAGAGETTAL